MKPQRKDMFHMILSPAHKASRRTCVFLYLQSWAAPITRVFLSKGTWAKQSWLIQESEKKRQRWHCCFSPVFFLFFGLYVPVFQLHFHLWELPTAMTGFTSGHQNSSGGLMPCSVVPEHQWTQFQWESTFLKSFQQEFYDGRFQEDKTHQTVKHRQAFYKTTRLNFTTLESFHGDNHDYGLNNDEANNRFIQFAL